MNKNFKKILTSTLSLIMLIVLVACGSKGEKPSLTAEIDKNGAKIKSEYFADGDKINKIKTVTKVDLSKRSEKQIEALKNSLKNLDEIYSTIESAKYNYKIENNILRENLEYDVSKKEYIKALAEKKLIQTSLNTDYISLKMSKQLLESQGYTVKEHK